MAADTADRVRLARKLGLHPLVDSDLEEGTHYTVLAYTDWADMFVPTIVKWRHGPTDDLTDPATSKQHKQAALKQGGQ